MARNIKDFKMGSILNFNGRYLYPISKEHLSILKDWRNSQMDILRQWKPLTEYNQEKWFRKISEDNTQVIFAIMVPNEKEKSMRFIGYCGITNIDFRNRRGEISFLVNPVRVQDKKLYREDFLSVLYMLCQYGFEELNLHKIFAETFDFREDIIKELEEFGFNLNGILRDHQFIKGKYYSSNIHSILYKEWNNTKKRIKRY